MIKQSDNKASMRGLVILIMNVLIMKISDATPTLWFNEGMNAGWMLPILSALFLMIPLAALLSLLKKYKDKNLIDIIYVLTGKYLSFILGLTVVLILMSEMVLNSRSYVGILSIMYFTKTPKIVLYIILMGVSCFVAVKGIKVMEGVQWGLTITLQTVSLIIFLAAIPRMRFNYLFPIGGPGIVNLIKGGVTYSSVLGDILFFSIIFNFFKGYKEYRKGTYLAFGISTFEIAAFLALYVTVFDYPAIGIINYPMHQTTRLLQFGRFFKNVEAFFLGFWVLGAFSRFAIYLYMVSAAFAYTLKMKKFEPLILSFGGLALLLGLIPENFTSNTLIARVILLKYAWLFEFLLPVTLWILSEARGEGG